MLNGKVAFDSSDLDVEQLMPLICLPDLICNCLLTHMHGDMSPAQPHFSVSNTGRRQDGVVEGDNEAAIFLTAPDNGRIKSSFALTANCFGQLSYEQRTRSADEMSDFMTLFFHCSQGVTRGP